VQRYVGKCGTKWHGPKRIAKSAGAHLLRIARSHGRAGHSVAGLHSAGQRRAGRWHAGHSRAVPIPAESRPRRAVQIGVEPWEGGQGCAGARRGRTDPHRAAPGRTARGRCLAEPYRIEAGPCRSEQSHERPNRPHRAGQGDAGPSHAAPITQSKNECLWDSDRSTLPNFKVHHLP
jgi:hypothetical protein